MFGITIVHPHVGKESSEGTERIGEAASSGERPFSQETSKGYTKMHADIGHIAGQSCRPEGPNQSRTRHNQTTHDDDTKQPKHGVSSFPTDAGGR